MYIYVLGTDKRTAYCAAYLKKTYGKDVILCDRKECIYRPDVLVLPYVSFKNGSFLNTADINPACEILDRAPRGSKLFAGMTYDGFEDECKQSEITLFDYFKNEELTRKNADLTAEGAVARVIKNTDSAISGMKITVTGFGRVARSCARVFEALGASVTVMARKRSAREDAQVCGYRAVDINDSSALESADVIINTVPSLVLAKDMLCTAKNCRYILDLASAPYGTDFEAARSMGINAETAPGLPAECAPETAGRFIAEYIISELERGGE